MEREYEGTGKKWENREDDSWVVWALGSNNAATVALPCLIYHVSKQHLCRDCLTRLREEGPHHLASCTLLLIRNEARTNAALQVTKSSECSGLDLFQVGSVKKVLSAPGWMTHLLFALGGLG